MIFFLQDVFYFEKDLDVLLSNVKRSYYNSIQDIQAEEGR